MTPAAINEVIERCCDTYGAPIADVLNLKAGNQAVRDARIAAMAKLRIDHGLSLKKTAKALGRAHHGSVLYAVRQVSPSFRKAAMKGK